MENGNGVDSCDKAEVNLDKNTETAAVVIMALENEKSPPSVDDGVSDDKLKPCITVDNNKDSPSLDTKVPDSIKVEENVELKDKSSEETAKDEEEENKENGEVVDNVPTIKVEPEQVETVEEKPLSPPPEKMDDAEASEVKKAEEASVEEAKESTLEEAEEDEEEIPGDNDKKNSNAEMEIEDQQSSTSSSPSALHIHLDEEDKDESLNDKDKETADPSLPLISNVVSLSSIASSSSSLTPPPPTRSDQSPSTQPPSPTPSAESGNSSVRRTTLRFKRGIEISFDVDQNGQPVSVNNHEANPMPSASSGEPRQKRGRMEEEDEEDASQPDISELDAEGTSNVLSSVQKDIRTLRFMAKQKEKEWNYILKLMKVKEELQAKLMRRREVLKITSSSIRKNVPNSNQTHTVAQAHVQQHQQQQQSGASNLQTFINHSLNTMMGKSSGLSKSIMSNSPVMNHQQSQQLIQQQQQLHQHQLQQHQLHQHQLQQQAKMNRQRPILPKPSLQIHPEVQMWTQQQQQQQQQQNQHHHHHHHSNHNNNSSNNHHHHNTVVDSVVGACADSQADARNRQGTISVQSLIADYRAKHPEEIPTRGRRIRQPSRICNDPNSSSSPPPNSQPGGQDGANMSFKDVLLQFAKMSSRQGHPNPVDMIQVGKESPGTSGNSAMAGSSSGGSSSAAALQNLAAARNARSSPHTASLSAGSILQSALSGGRTNPNFAPTLAQLLTNPANEQQQQQQQHQQQQQQHPQQSPLGSNQPAISIPVASASSSSSSAAVAAAAAAAAASAASSAEVLTLSNLLATARGHVTITSERAELANDDVTVVGGSTSGGRNVSSNNGNYLRTSGGSEVPKCQGCNERVAQFVCAGCSSQWYCSRECQVAAWEEHSEHCVG